MSSPFRIVRTFADIYWPAQIRRARACRLMTDEQRMIAYTALRSVPGLVVDVFIWILGEDPLSTMQERLVTGTEPGILASISPADFPLAADLQTMVDDTMKLPFNPAQPQRRGGDDHIGDAWLAMDAAEICARITCRGMVFEKLKGAARTNDPIYYADPTFPVADWWVRVENGAAA